MGHTLTLDVPEDVYQSLIQKAEQTGQPPEAVAVQLLATATQHRVDDPVEQFIGAFSSHGVDWTNQHDAYLGKAGKDSTDRCVHCGAESLTFTTDHHFEQAGFVCLLKV